MPSLFETGVSYINKAVAFDQKSSDLPRRPFVEEYEDAIRNYRQGIEILLKSLQCSTVVRITA